MKIDLLPFETSPEPFRKNGVCGPSFAIHRDLDVPGPKLVEVGVTGEVASLITVEDRRRGRLEGPFQTFQDKRHLKGLVELPGHHIATELVEDCDQIEPSLRKPNIGKIDAPHMVRMLGCDSPEKIGIDLMFQAPPTEVRARMNPFDSHLSHCRPDTVSPHGYPLFFKQGGNPTAPIIGVGGVDLVNSVPKLNLFRRRDHRLVVEN